MLDLFISVLLTFEHKVLEVEARNTFLCLGITVGFVKISPKVREKLQKMIDWYFFRSEYKQKFVVLIVDGSLGLTDLDMEMLFALEQAQKNVIVVANKIDKIKKSEYEKQIEEIQFQVGNHTMIPYSAEKKIGVGELAAMLLK